jgi:hypothetical protein
MIDMILVHTSFLWHPIDDRYDRYAIDPIDDRHVIDPIDDRHDNMIDNDISLWHPIDDRY